MRPPKECPQCDKDLAEQMRETATFLEHLNNLYDGNMYKWSPELLRYEADYLDRPIPGEAS